MTTTVSLAVARELAAAGSVRETVLIGQRGGYAVAFKVGMGERVLATKTGQPRLFGGVPAAARVLHDLGIARYLVDATGLSEGDLMRRRRPDRAVALKQTHEDAAYVAFLAERAEVGRRDPERYSNAQVEADMAAILAEYGA